MLSYQAGGIEESKLNILFYHPTISTVLFMKSEVYPLTPINIQIYLAKIKILLRG